MSTLQASVEEQARLLAADNSGNSDIQKIYWFPHPTEVRLIELTDEIPITLDGKLHPFYFGPSPQDGLPSPSATTLIRPDEFGKLQLPKGWLPWEEAVLLWERT